MFKVLREVKDGFVVCLRTPDEQRAKEICSFLNDRFDKMNKNKKKYD